MRPALAAPADGEELVKRIGKKLNGRYALVSIFSSRSKIRLVVSVPVSRATMPMWPHIPFMQVYFQTTCQKHELVCTLNESDFPAEVCALLALP